MRVRVCPYRLSANLILSGAVAIVVAITKFEVLRTTIPIILFCIVAAAYEVKK